ncbi:TetR/AcrR family transcriptional regulator [Kitasatospora paracochleata]
MVTERAAGRRPPGRRAQVLAAAEGLFHRRGYHRVSMAEVAAEVGITAPALYRHFRSKPELLRCAVTGGLDALREAVRAGKDGPEQLCAALAPAAIDHRALGTLWRRDARLLPPAQRAALRRELRAVVAETAAVVATGYPGRPAADTDLVCRSLLSAYGGLGNHTFAPPRRAFEALLRRIGADLLAVDLAAAPVLPPGRGLPYPAPVTRREALLVTAVRLFHERGFDNVSTEELGAAVGIAGPSVYKHFGTKAELLAAALVRSRERLWQEVAGPLEGTGEPAAALAAGLAAYVDFARRNSDYLGAMVSETERLDPSDRRVAVEFRRDFLRRWVALLQQVRPGYGDAEARIRVHAMFALVNDGVRGPAGAGDTGGALVALGRAALGLDAADG